MAEIPTPLTDAAALGFARLLVDRDTAQLTEIIPADFARTLERRVALLEAGLLALVEDCENKWGDPHTLREARALLERKP